MLLRYWRIAEGGGTRRDPVPNNNISVAKLETLRRLKGRGLRTWLRYDHLKYLEVVCGPARPEGLRDVP